MTHECLQMTRSREIQTIIGQQAYILYKHWLEKQRRKPPPIETFVSSTYYSSFIKFAAYCRETSIADQELYVDLMVKAGISPALWTRSEAYDIYLEHVDKRADPYQQAEISLNTLSTLSERLEVPISDVISKLKYGEMLELIQQRKLSPWILFCSSKFKAWVSKLDPHEHELLMKNIGIAYWSMMLEKRTDVVKDMVEIAKGAGI